MKSFKKSTDPFPLTDKMASTSVSEKLKALWPMNLKELSRHLGLSPTTVSRALNGYPEVSERTRQRVMEAAAKHNYSPNTRAKRLATGRAMTIGHLLPLSREHEVVNPIFADFIAGASKRYSDSGYDLLLSVVRDEDETEAYRELATRGAVDGVVVHGPKVNDRRIEMLRELRLPFVVHGRSSDVSDDYNWIDVNNRRAFFRAASFLLDLGHRSIALINGIANMDFASRRYQGYTDALKERGVRVDDSLVFHGEMTETYGYDTTCALLSRPSPPTALLVSSIIPAIGARRAISDFGLRMGEDISVVIHDDDLSYFRNEGEVPTYTATRSSVREAGWHVADVLLDTINSAEPAPRNLLLEAELMVGQSTGPAPAVRQLMEQG